MLTMGPMWRPGNLGHLLAWFVSLLYSVICAAGWWSSRARRRRATSVVAVPAWLMNGASSVPSFLRCLGIKKKEKPI